ncbi:hypothetical protein RHMOL_Rhmol07G0048400 [Rhododendron molle]|uniref:Uncharacterized protein n=1 Tax=Rhododendron molle TaxID=49168 RepID=A0ACC0MX46_RHOML|nr:hypothetical protein RHMOL_Rhmol07G0048400 [Rhododendron molle]
MDLDDEGRLVNVFWADARSKAACKEFGDVVTFNTTYLVSRYNMPFAPFVGVNHHGQSILLGCGLISHEDTKSFSWLFKTWMTCMWECAPKAIITDQCMSMKNAIEEVFPNTRHRWCIWHILKKVPEKLGKYDAYKSISTSLHNAVYDSLIIKEFEDAWDVFIKKYQLQGNEWLHELYLERNRWVPAFVKDVFWAGMSSTQRSESMNSYFDGYINSKTTLKQFVKQYENALAKKVENEKHEDTKDLHSYIPCITAVELEKQFQNTYTHAKFKEFYVEFFGKLNCSLKERKVCDVWSEYKVQEDMTFGEVGEEWTKRVPFTIEFNGAAMFAPMVNPYESSMTKKDMFGTWEISNPLVFAILARYWGWSPELEPPTWWSEVVMRVVGEGGGDGDPRHRSQVVDNQICAGKTIFWAEWRSRPGSIRKSRDDYFMSNSTPINPVATSMTANDLAPREFSKWIPCLMRIGIPNGSWALDHGWFKLDCVAAFFQKWIPYVPVEDRNSQWIKLDCDAAFFLVVEIYPS